MNKYKVTYKEDLNSSHTHVDSYENLQNALDRYNSLISDFYTYADVKLVVETVLMSKA